MKPWARDFLLKWFEGPLGVAEAREVFWCRGPPRGSGFKHRGQYTVEGFRLLLEKDLQRARDYTLLLGVGFIRPECLFSELSEDCLLYDTIQYDFDCEEEPERAVERGLEFAGSIRRGYGVDPVVYHTGRKGARIVVPLSKPTDYEGYSAIWRALIQPYRYLSMKCRDKPLVDPSMVENYRQLSRPPYTYNLKEGEKPRLARIIEPRIRAEEFEWSLLKPLDPRSVVVYRLVLPKIEARRLRPRTHAKPTKLMLPQDPIELVDSEAAPPCIRNILKTLRDSGDPDHMQRVWLVVYLKRLGYPPEAAISLFKRFAKDYRESITRYQVEYIYRKDYRMPSCRKMKELGLCLNCGYTRDPVSYTLSRAKQLKPEGKEAWNPSSLGLVGRFLEETGLREFGYDDFKRWLESKKGALSAEEWSSYSRILRMLAQKGLLGRKFLVNGKWVDVGPGKIEEPPSKTVRFYILERPRIVSPVGMEAKLKPGTGEIRSGDKHCVLQGKEG